jgi:hypothetical protein
MRIFLADDQAKVRSAQPSVVGEATEVKDLSAQPRYSC